MQVLYSLCVYPLISARVYSSHVFLFVYMSFYATAILSFRLHVSFAVCLLIMANVLQCEV